MTTQPARFEAALERAADPGSAARGVATPAPTRPPPRPPAAAGFVKVLPPLGGKVAVRFERWGDLRGDCRAKLTIRTSEPMRLVAKKHKKAAAARRHKTRKSRLKWAPPSSRSRPALRTTGWVALDRTARRLLKRHRWVRRVELRGTATDAAPGLTLGRELPPSFQYLNETPSGSELGDAVLDRHVLADHLGDPQVADRPSNGRHGGLRRALP